MPRIDFARAVLWVFLDCSWGQEPTNTDAAVFLVSLGALCLEFFGTTSSHAPVETPID